MTSVTVEDRILDAAKHCCERWGIAKVTIDDIAAAARVSRATLYRLFPGGKDVLFEALRVRELNEFFGRLRLAIDPTRHELRVNSSLVRWSVRNSFIPDVAFLPREQVRTQEGTGTLERYADPLPFVVEIWSPSSGGYDLDVKVTAYKARGDAEIWRLHPYQRTLTRWVRQPNGSYAEFVHTGGFIELHALPGVAIDLDALFGG